MPKKVDPLKQENVRPGSVMLTVTDVKAAINFYQKAFGFAKRGVMNGPGKKPICAELTLRGTTLMLGPEDLGRGARSAKSVGASPATLSLTVEDVDKIFAKALKAGPTAEGPVMDMFWGDRCGTILDPDGNRWMIGTHVAEPTPEEMKRKWRSKCVARQPTPKLEIHHTKSASSFGLSRLTSGATESVILGRASV